MNLKCIIYISIIMVFSCMKPTLLEKDCNGVIGGVAVVDDCGFCTGGTTNLSFNYFWGCDGECKGSQFDCTYPGDLTCISTNPPETCVTACNGDYVTDCLENCIHKNQAREFDLCDVCDPCGDGTKDDSCWNATCNGCTNPNNACGSYDENATVYKEFSCIQLGYSCSDSVIMNGSEITEGFELIIEETTCSDTENFDQINNCGPGKDLCKFFPTLFGVECSEPEDSTIFLPCDLELTNQGYYAFEEFIGDGECDYYFVNDALYNIASCPEFGYDGGTPEANFTDGDCNLVDCKGVHFSDIFCEVEFESDPIIDTLINLSPDSLVIQTSTLITYIGGCKDASYTDITTIETRYIYNAIDSIITIVDSTEISSQGWLGDGECDSDSEGYLFTNYGLDFNCIEHDYEGGDCNISSDRIRSRKKHLIKNDFILQHKYEQFEKIQRFLNSH